MKACCVITCQSDKCYSFFG